MYNIKIKCIINRQIITHAFLQFWENLIYVSQLTLSWRQICRRCNVENIENQTLYTKLSFSYLELDSICHLSFGKEDSEGVTKVTTKVRVSKWRRYFDFRLNQPFKPWGNSARRSALHLSQGVVLCKVPLLRNPDQCLHGFPSAKSAVSTTGDFIKCDGGFRSQSRPYYCTKPTNLALQFTKPFE